MADVLTAAPSLDIDPFSDALADPYPSAGAPVRRLDNTLRGLASLPLRVT